jgi:hypothetical protein
MGWPQDPTPSSPGCARGLSKRDIPPRKMPKVWDPDPVLQIFMHWDLPLSCAQLMRKCAFIVALLSGRRLSELFDLKCDSNHMQLTNTFVQFIPASLSKTDWASRISPSICLRSYSKDASLCPVAIICALLVERDALDIRHNRLLFNPRRPDSLVTLAIFKGFIERSLRDAGIDARPRFNARHGSVFRPGKKSING